MRLVVRPPLDVPLAPSASPALAYTPLPEAEPLDERVVLHVRPASAASAGPKVGPLAVRPAGLADRRLPAAAATAALLPNTADGPIRP